MTDPKLALIKQELDIWLDQVDYAEINSSDYMPSEFALTFMNFIKLVNGAQGESHKTPPFHLKMLDKVVGGNNYVANLCFRVHPRPRCLWNICPCSSRCSTTCRGSG